MHDELSSIFVKWSLSEWWDTLLQAYKEMGFTDELTDAVRIEEFAKITELMNNYTDKAEKAVSKHWPLKKDEAIEAFASINERIAPKTRVNLVYIRLRNNWCELTLAKLNRLLMNEVQQMASEEEGSDRDDRSHYQF